MSDHLKYPFNPIIWPASPHDFTASDGLHNRNLGVYTAELTQRYTWGTRCLKWDGRVFRYGRCGTTWTSTTMGVKNGTILVSNRVTHAVAAPATTAVGETALAVTCTAGELGDSTSTTNATRTGVIAEDELAAGYIHIQTIPVAGTEHDENRMIVGNDALAIGDTTLYLYLDAPLNYATLTGTSTCEILASPYANLRRSNDEWTAVMGMPNVTATALQHLWLQTWGPCRVSPTTDTPSTNNRQYVFDDFGTAVPAAGVFGGTADSFQHAGFLLEMTEATAYYHAPFIMLQISP